MSLAILRAGCASFVLALPGAAWAQAGAPAATASQAEAAANDQGSAGDIVVTAQKRSEKLNDVPMAITAATGEALVSQGITQVSQLARIEPSLQFSPSNNGTPVYTIRGVGYFEQSLSATPAVSLYQDEVPFTYPVMTRGAMMDVERVEILKGPQGTLYGQNATGGLINFIAARPTDSFEAGVQASLARFNSTILNGFVSGPLSSTVSARLAVQTEHGGAWQRSVTRNDRLGDKDTNIARLLLDWKPTDNFTARLNVNGWTDRSETQAGQLVGFRFLSPQYISPVTAAQQSDPRSYLPNPAYLAAGIYPAGIARLLQNPIPPRNNRAADWDVGTHPKADQNYFQTSLRLEYETAGGVTLTSLTAYQRFRQNDQRDIDGVDVNDQYYIIHGKVDSVFQELRAGGDLGQGGRWIVGANYARDVTKERDDAPDTLQSGSYLTGGSPYSLLPFAPWLDYFVRNDVRARTLSAFGNLDLALTDRLMAHAGIRYTDSRQQMAGCTGTADANLLAFFRLLLRPGARAATPGGCTTILQNGDQGLTNERLNETNVPFQLGLDYKIEPDKLVYASIRKGFKAGTTPAVVPTSYIQRTPVTQESLLAYEGGFKLSLMDRQLQLNGAGFIYDYTDKQLLGRIIDPTGVFGALQALVNIPKSRVHGAELTATVTPREVRGLTVGAAVTWLDSKVTSNFVNYASYVASAADTIDFKGEPYPYTPRWAVRGGVRYEWMATDRIRANVGANGSAQSRMNGAFGAQKASREGPSILIKPYGLLDLSAGIEAADRRWRVDLWGRNVTNTYYWNTAFYQSDTTVRYNGMPATYGVTASINFR